MRSLSILFFLIAGVIYMISTSVMHEILATLFVIAFAVSLGTGEIVAAIKLSDKRRKKR